MRFALGFFAMGLVACAPPEDDDHVHPDDLVAGHNFNRTMQGLSQPGRWAIPDDVMAVGDQQDVEFNNAPPYDGGSNCSGGATDGALTLRDHLIGFFPQIETVGIYNCRVIAGTNSMSLHGVGRALDVMMPTVDGAADNDLGDPIAHWLIENAEAIGIQTIIWDRTIWRVSNNPREHEYTGENPHVDHLHVEVNVLAGNEGTPWFDAPFGPETCEPLGVVTEAGVVVDDGDQCFQLFGPAQFWRHETVGEQGDLAWTNAFENETKSNWARWSLPLESAGTFEVQVFIEPTFGVFDHTLYEVTASGETTQIIVDQGAADGWTTLGQFAFTGDGSESVVVVDNFAGAVGDEQHVVADALRVRIPQAPPVEEPIEEEEEPPPVDEEEEPIDPGPVDDEDPEVVIERQTLQPSTSAAGGCSAGGAPMLFALLAVLRRRRR
jgi:hypothetical protein